MQLSYYLLLFSDIYELWNSLKQSDIRRLEIIHRYCLKRIQGFHIPTRTDITLGMLGILDMESLIEQRKLAFLGYAVQIEKQLEY